jgi:hypothetical protein
MVVPNGIRSLGTGASYLTRLSELSQPTGSVVDAHGDGRREMAKGLHARP